MKSKNIVACIAGTIFEWYDFILFVGMAGILTKVFFPQFNAEDGKIMTFTVFAVGFLMRPLGALYFGHRGDKYGRRKSAITCFALMIASTALIAFLPGHLPTASLILLVSLRLLQGFATSGEFSSAITLLVEHAGEKRYCFLSSFSSVASIVGILFGTAVCSGFSMWLGEKTMIAWGWRIPFLMSIPFGIVIWNLRKSLKESEAFLNLRQNKDHAERPLTIFFRKHFKAILLAIGIGMVSNLGFYLNFVYINSIQPHYHESSAFTHFYSTSLILIAYGCAMPLFAYFADYLNYKKIMLLGCLTLMLITIPTIHLVENGGEVAKLMGQILFSFILGIYGGCVPAFLGKLFPVQVRCLGVGVGMNFSAAIFGGTAPLISAYLVKLTGNIYLPAIYLCISVCVAILAISRSELKSNSIKPKIDYIGV